MDRPLSTKSGNYSTQQKPRRKTSAQLRQEAVQLYSQKVRELNMRKYGQPRYSTALRAPSPLRESSQEGKLHRSLVDADVNVSLSTSGPGGHDARSTRRSTSYNQLQSSKDRYMSVQMSKRSLESGTMRRKRQENTLFQSRLSTSSYSRSPIPSQKPSSVGRRANPCAKSFASIHDKIGKAKKLLRGVELKDQMSRRSVHSVQTAQP